MTITPEIAQAIDAHPKRDARTRWRHDSVGTTMTDLLTKARRLAGITPAEVAAAMTLLASTDAEHATGSVGIGTQGTPDILYIGAREIRFRADRWLSSANMPGLFTARTMPPQPETHQQAAEQVNGLLAEMGHAPQVTAAARVRLRYVEDFETTVFTIRTPEREGSYELFASYVHSDAENRLEKSREIADIIDQRIRNRESIQQARLQVEREVAAAIAKVDRMRVVGSVFNVESWAARKGVFKGTALAEVEVIGDMLETKVITTLIHKDDQSHLKRQIAQHRANLRRLDARPGGDALVCDPILAAAIRAVAHRHGAGLLAEIEAALAGGAANATNPVLRGISNLSFHRGMLTGAVTLARGTRHTKERVNATSIRQVPDTILQSLPGRRLRDVVDHPYLEGLVIKSVTVNSRGLHIRPEPAPVPLSEVLADLREAVKENKR